MAKQLKELLELGRELGLDKEQLQIFISKETERQEKEYEREEKAKEYEREEKAKEYERQEKAKEYERQEKAAEREERYRMRELDNREKEMELRKLEIQLNLDKSATNQGSSEDKSTPRIPKLPMFNKDDDMPDFLDRFKNHAKAANWKPEAWTSYLINLLSGEALKVVNYLSDEDRTSFAALEKALLKHFSFTKHDYREKFFNCYPDKGQPFTSYVNKLSKYFNKWIELSNVKQTYEDLYDFILRDTIMQQCNEAIVVFIKERDPPTVKEMTDLADKFIDAHPNMQLRKNIQANTAYNREGMSFQKPSNFRQANRQQEFHRPSRERYTKDRFSHNNQDRYGYRDHARHQSRGYSGPPGQRPRSQSCDSRFHNRPDWRNNSHDNNRQDWRNNNYESNRQKWNRNGNTNRQNQRHRSNSRSRDNSTQYANTSTQDASTENTSTILNDTARAREDYSNIACSRANNPFPLFQGLCNNQACTVLRDSGSNCIGIHNHLIKSSDLTGRSTTVNVYGGSKIKFETAIVNLDTPIYKGTAEAHVLTGESPADVIIGNVDGLITPQCEEVFDRNEPSTANTVTRAQSRLESQQSQAPPEHLNPQTPAEDKDTNDFSFNNFDPTEFERAQKEDEECRRIANSANTDPNSNYFIENNILHRRKCINGKESTQIVVPKSFKNKILQAAHDAPDSAHLGIQSTKKRLIKKFTWPSMFVDVNRYVKSCDICQRKTSRLPELPIEEMESISTPFQKVAIDVIGPLPLTKDKHRYILTMVDYATRWPEAIALKNICTSDIIQALKSIFTRLGYPAQILSDNAKQLTSKQMEEALKSMGIEQRTSTAYHPKSNGLCERFNGSLKKMLNRLCNDKPNTWNTMLDSVLFAYRQSTHSSFPYSPFQLMYGRVPRTHMDLIYDLCTGTKTLDSEQVQIHEYVTQITRKIEDQCATAQQAIKTSASRYKKYADQQKHYRKYVKDEEVLVLLPTNQNNLFMRYQGPYPIVSQGANNNYNVRIGRQIRTYHANLLKKYIRRPTLISNHVMAQDIANIAYVQEDEMTEIEQSPPLEMGTYCQNETFLDAKINDNLSESQKETVVEILKKYHRTLSDCPGKTNLMEHEILLNDYTPFRLSYPIPYHAKDEVDKEIVMMEERGIVRKSKSPFCSPLTIVRKTDKTIRPCLDFRKLNSKVIFHAQPIPNRDELFTKIGPAKFFTKLDLSKGYWQIPLKEESKKYTAFRVGDKFLEFNYLPFGLSTSGSSFQALMLETLQGIDHVLSYFDDILIFSQSWHQHLNDIEQVLKALERAGLTAKPSKTHIGFQEIEFLGHVITHRQIKPNQSKIDKMRELQPPTSKKEVKKICGLLNYYRHFVPNFSGITAPLTNLLKKTQPNKVCWNTECEESFTRIKHALTSSPILALPDLNKPFTVRTDASSKAIAGVLLQEQDNFLKPIHYVSRKLLDRETKYPIIEQECLAIVFSINAFSRYLAIKPFILETDHRPMTYLKKSSTKNNRLTRWALAIQNYSFEVHPIPGKDNLISDLLTRL